MNKTILLTAAALLFSVAAARMATAQVATTRVATAEQGYTHSVACTRTGPIVWKPEETTRQRYTVSVSPLRMVSNGMKFDFECELLKPGHWLGTSLAVYLAPQRRPGYGDTYWNSDGNDRSWFNSGWGSYHRMWGLGTSAFFKNTFSHRGWYYSAGVVFEFFRVGVTFNTYTPHEVDGLTFYDYGRELETKSYFKPTAQINIGKHMALSERCYFDLYAGLGFSFAFYEKDNRHIHRYDRDHAHHGNSHPHYWSLFSGPGGFARRGFTPVGGFRFGVLLWKPRQ